MENIGFVSFHRTQADPQSTRNLLTLQSDTTEIDNFKFSGCKLIRTLFHLPFNAFNDTRNIPTKIFAAIGNGLHGINDVTHRRRFTDKTVNADAKQFHNVLFFTLAGKRFQA